MPGSLGLCSAMLIFSLPSHSGGRYICRPEEWPPKERFFAALRMTTEEQIPLADQMHRPSE